MTTQELNAALAGIEYERVELAGGRAVLYRGDCLELLAAGVLGASDVLVTDPPYGIRNRYGTVKRPSGRRTMEFDFDKRNGVREDVRDGVRGCVRLLNAPRAAFVFCGTDTLEYVRSELVASGMTTKPFAWTKAHPPPPMPGNWWPSAFELALYAFDSGAWFGDNANHKRRNVYHGDSLRNGNREKVPHPTQKPLHLMKYIVSSMVRPGATVLDPYMGSGSTGVAALQSGRRFVGVEIEQRHFDTACRRIEAVGL